MPDKKILFVAPRFHTNQFFLTKQLLDKKVEVNFLSIYIGGSENHKFLKPILSIPSTLVKWLLKKRNSKNAVDRETLSKFHITSFAQCYEIYKKINPDIIIIRNLRPFISIQHFLIGIVLRKKVYLYTQNNYRQKLDFKRKLFYRSLKIFGVKHFTPVLGDSAQPIIPNTIYIPFVVDKMVDKEKVNAKNQYAGIQVMTIGKMQDRKNLRELVDSLIRINFFNSINNKLVIASECIGEQHYNYLLSIKESIKQHESQVEFFLNVNHDKIFKLLETSDLFVLPSHDEPAAFSVLEAMACGVAVVCSNKNGTKCYIQNDVNGYVFKYTKDFAHLDVVLRKILEKNRLVAYGLANLECINQHHTIDSFYRNVIENECL